MTDPKRWSEGGEASPLERELLLTGQSVRLPETERRALWAGIALSLPVVAPASVVPKAPLAVASGWGAYVTKGVIFLAAVGGLTFGASRLWQHREPAAKARASLPVAVATTTTVAPAAAAPAAVVTAAAPPAVVTNDAKPRVSPASQLREESVAVLEARAALRSGDATRSLALLEQARTRFPRGALGQEREALTIQALAQSGERAAARRRAEAFLHAHPTSPYVADVRMVAGQ